MTLIATTLILILFPISEAFKDAWMWEDYGNDSQSQSANARWHALDFIWQAFLIIAVSTIAAQKSASTWQFCAFYALFGASWFWLVNDLLVNVVGLGKPAAYIGTTSKIDKLLRQIFGAEAGYFVLGMKTALVIISGVAAYLIF